MPTMANITVKKADGTTDVVYTATQASSGDGSPALWVSLTHSAVRAMRALVKVVARDNGPKDARKVEVQYRYPVIRVVGGVDTVVATVPVSIVTTVANILTEAEINEAISQGLNLANSALVKACMKDGYSAV